MVVVHPAIYSLDLNKTKSYFCSNLNHPCKIRRLGTVSYLGSAWPNRATRAPWPRAWELGLTLRHKELILLTVTQMVRTGSATSVWFEQASTASRSSSGGALTSRECAEASLCSLLASCPANCSKRRRKTRIWWLPRVHRVLDLWAKIPTMGCAIYRCSWSYS
jgi:hypothetical protein